MDEAPRLPLKARVRLRDGLGTALYDGMAKVGNEGWITDRRSDRFGFPEVYIHWDQFHWAYNYQPDGWTFEDHFDIVKTMADNNDIRKQISDMAAGFAKLAESLDDGPPDAFPEAEAEAPEDTQSDFATDEAYDQSIAKAVKTLQASEAFMLVAINREPHPMVKEGMLKPSVVGNAKTADTQVVVGMQLSQLAAGYHHDAALSLIGTMGDGPTPVTG
jgi:hypothetical protein